MAGRHRGLRRALRLDLFLVNRAAFRQATLQEAWTGFPDGTWEPFTSAISRKLELSRRFAMLDLANECAVVDDGQVAVVPATCLRTISSASPRSNAYEGDVRFSARPGSPPESFHQ